MSQPFITRTGLKRDSFFRFLANLSDGWKEKTRVGPMVSKLQVINPAQQFNWVDPLDVLANRPDIRPLMNERKGVNKQMQPCKGDSFNQDLNVAQGSKSPSTCPRDTRGKKKDMFLDGGHKSKPLRVKSSWFDKQTDAEGKHSGFKKVRFDKVDVEAAAFGWARNPQAIRFSPFKGLRFPLPPIAFKHGKRIPYVTNSEWSQLVQGNMVKFEEVEKEKNN